MNRLENGPPTLLTEHLAALDLDGLRQEFEANGEFIEIANFLPPRLLNELLLTLPALESRVHRNFIPRHKKGGSVSRFDLDELAPRFGALYSAPELNTVLSTLCNRELLTCPDRDPHTYALYYYTEPGDHVGFHYDTSYYKGQRYTALLSLVNDSSCRLEYELFRNDKKRTTICDDTFLAPGAFVFFNGDKLYHRISPCGAGERRVALTFEYVTDRSMSPFRRFVSNIKDSVAYFGFRQVFSGQIRK